MTQTIVAKLGGAVASDAAQLDAIGRDLASLTANGAKVVIVHGGGPQVSAVSRSLGIEPNIVGGRRITDAATLEVVKYVLAGQMNIDFTTAFGRAGLRTVGISGVSSGLVAAVKRPPRVVSGGGDEPIDFGHVGDIVGVNDHLLRTLLDEGYTPVINSVAADSEHRVYNINADIAGTRIAAALNADHLVLLTGGVPGVLRDKDDLQTRIPRLTAAEARQAIADQVIVGGMIPKIEEGLNVLDRVGALHILGAVEAGDLRQALDAPGTVGTAIVS